MSYPDIPQEAITELHRRYTEDLNMQVRGLLTGAGIDVDRVIEAIEIGLENDEVQRARTLLATVMPEPVVPLLRTSRVGHNHKIELTTEGQTIWRHVADLERLGHCPNCHAVFDYASKTWSREPCREIQL